MEQRSLEEMENDFWPDAPQYPSGLIRRCHEFRKIPVSKLNGNQLNTLIGQRIGLALILEPAIRLLEKNFLEDADLFEGCLMERVVGIPKELWQGRENLQLRMIQAAKLQSGALMEEYGEAGYREWLQKIEGLLA